MRLGLLSTLDHLHGEEISVDEDDSDDSGEIIIATKYATSLR